MSLCVAIGCYRSLCATMRRCVSLCVSQDATYLGQVQVDLVTVKVSVEAGAVGVVHPDGAFTLEHPGPVKTHIGTASTITAMA